MVFRSRSRSSRQLSSDRIARLPLLLQGPEQLCQAASYPPSVPFSSLSLPSFLQHFRFNGRSKPDCLTRLLNCVLKPSQCQVLYDKSFEQHSRCPNATNATPITSANDRAARSSIMTISLRARQGDGLGLP